MVLSGLIIALSLAGLINALYFTLAYYGRVRRARWVPEILCAREGSSCVTVVQTPYARVFGVPNSLLGAFYYGILILWAASGGTNYVHIFGIFLRFVWLLIAASLATVVLGLYLTDALVRKLRTHCQLCYLGHAVNATLLVLLVIAAR